MLRKLAAALTISVASLGVLGTAPAGAITLPPGNGSIACSVAGTVKVVRTLAHPTVVHIRVVGAVSNCTYNGVAIPFAGGTSRSVSVGDPTTLCAKLNEGGTLTKSVTRVVAFGRVVGVVSGTGTLSPATPSGAGSAISIDGTFVARTVTVTASVSVLTDRPVADLCNGAKSLNFTGTVSASWVRA